MSIGIFGLGAPMDKFRINISLLSVLLSLGLYAAFREPTAVVALTVSFAAYFADKYFVIKPKHIKEIKQYEDKLAEMETKLNKVSIKMGFGY